MFDWLREEAQTIRTPKFHQFGVDTTRRHESPIDWPCQPPADYRRFIEEFGPSGLYRLESYWEITVYARPVIFDDPKKGRFLKFGGRNPGIACFKLEELEHGGTAVYETRGVSGLFPGAASFAEWFQRAAKGVRKTIRKADWQRIVAGPAPFTEAEKALVALRSRYSWRLLNATASGEMEYEVTNGSTGRLDYLTVGVVAGALETRTRLEVGALAPGQTGRVRASLWRGYRNEKATLEAFSLPDPGPEDREHYSEFDTPEQTTARLARAEESMRKSLRSRYVTAASGSPDSLDPSDRMRAADKLVSEGHDAEALAHYLWCFDHSMEHDPAFVGVRSSFLLSRIWELGHELGFEPALAALRDRRDACFQRIQSDNAAPGEISDFACLNRALHESRRTLQLLDATPRGSSTWMELAYPLREYLYRSRRYSDLLLAFPPEETIASRAQGIDSACGGLRGHLEDRLLRLSAELIEALAAVGEHDRAVAMAREILKLLPGKGTRRALSTWAERAKDPKLIAALTAARP